MLFITNCIGYPTLSSENENGSLSNKQNSTSGFQDIIKTFQSCCNRKSHFVFDCGLPRGGTKASELCFSFLFAP